MGMHSNQDSNNILSRKRRRLNRLPSAANVKIKIIPLRVLFLFQIIPYGIGDVAKNLCNRS